MTRSPRSWLVEAALALVAVLAGVMLVRGSLGDGAPVVVEALAGLLSTAGLVLFRRSHPVALTLVLLPAGLVLGMPMGAFPVALFAVALHRGARPAAALAGLNSVAVAVVYFLGLGATTAYYQSVAFVILVHVSLVAVALLVRSHRLLVRSWSERARQAEEGQRLRVEQARLAERESIAREMHDVLAHRISLVAVHAGALELRRDAPPAERDAAGVIRRSAHEALQDLRVVIRMLRAPVADAHPQPTLADLPALADRARAAGIDLRLTLPPAGSVPASVGRHAYRIVQEAVTNAHTHAPGRPVTVTVTDHPDRELAVQVDNPLGPASEPAVRPSASSRAPEPSRADAAGDHPLPPRQGPAVTDAGLRVWSPARPADSVPAAEPAAPAAVSARSPHVSGPGPGVECGLSAAVSASWPCVSGSGPVLEGDSSTAVPAPDGSVPGPVVEGGSVTVAPAPEEGVPDSFAVAGSGSGRANSPSPSPSPASESETGTGLAALAERVRLIGGRLEHGPTGNRHFVLRAWLPYAAAAQPHGPESAGPGGAD